MSWNAAMRPNLPVSPPGVSVALMMDTSRASSASPNEYGDAAPERTARHVGRTTSFSPRYFANAVST